MIYVSRRLIITCLLLITACVVAGIWGLRSGTVTLETSQVFAALMGDAPRSMTMVVTEWRLPRVLMALLIGAALGVSGAIFQSLMRNPLGSPDVMGFNTGAWSGVLVAMVLFGQDLTAIALAAMVGGIVAHDLRLSPINHHLFAANYRLCGCRYLGITQRYRHAGNLAGIRRADGRCAAQYDDGGH